ncbi:phage head-tail connector protein [Gluconacetobacter sp. Hr-1-5]|uniref:phage head-tail connector protein n=1 Tax=Gluconacetobacter sp. Hr-1-5 TaxID=3395370 RepID=UPI003B52F67E
MRQTILAGPPAQPVALALLADLKADLGVTDDAQDSRLTTLLLDASDMVRTYIGRPILSATWRDVIELGPDEKCIGLTLGRCPVTAITAFSARGEAWSADAIGTLGQNSGAGMVFPPDGGPAMWRAGRYVVTYQAGWVAPSVGDDGKADPGTLPRSIQQATRLTAAALWHASGRDPLLRSESEQGVGSSSWGSSAPGVGGLPQAAADVLRGLGGVGVR